MTIDRRYIVERIDIMKPGGQMITGLDWTDDRHYAEARAAQYYRDFPNVIVRVVDKEHQEVILVLPNSLPTARMPGILSP